ncbi:sodium/hydrogen exchanger 3 [Ancylostoma duodenale]|uniref:Sodium/hydrogen exchanger 3 n=1 Tax=Ancylostoma duodenale TaxID=51022 RepID=A0A0C2CZU0_9BILA|nr:sodium/hydrogen exchanger 3 [Ancylostoma duodenale]
MARILFHKSQVLEKIFPESALLIVLGLIVGLILDELWVLDIYLHPDLFFLYLLPPIALDAGYFLPNNAFFLNIGTILLYAVVGTIFNIITIAGIIYAFLPLYQWSLPFIDILLFSTLISAVDPVAVLSVFEEIHVNQLLYICVFGESLLNDAVTIVLYHSLSSMAKIGSENLIREDFIHALINFAMVSTGGILIGLVWVCITAFATNIVTCGLLMKPYISGNLNDKALTTVNCEAIIFVFLGLSTFSKHHTWDLMFALVTVLACIFCRFIGVIILTWLANRKRVQKIDLMDQVIMGYGGLRGAICYGLVMTLDKDAIPAKDMLVSTTVVVIVVTVFFQGTTIKPLVRLLKVKTQEPQQKTVTQQVLTHSGDDMMAGVEAIIGMRGSNYWRRRLSEFNHNYVQPTLMRSPTSRGEKLMEKYSALSAEEQRLRLLERFGV